MIDSKDIPHLIKLLDDDSPVIQNKIITKLASFGSNLKPEIEKIPFHLSNRQKNLINRIFYQQKQIKLLQNWPRWFKCPNKFERLELALSILSDYLDEHEQQEVNLGSLLDGLCKEFQSRYFYQDCRLLAKFLFQDLKIKGDEENYYNPQNSNLKYVILQQKGIPISLAALYMLIGYRLGFNIEGCHFPGHFLAQVEYKGRIYFVDCFSSGQFINGKDILRLRRDVVGNLDAVFEERADIDTIVRRFLANLIRAYQIKKDEDNCQLFIKLFKDLEDHLIANENFSNITPEDIIKTQNLYFEVGNLIVHKRYGYRGIIVDVDSVCKATDLWYYSNQTQPNREQPWYHVLVHETNQVTYVAESNLDRDWSNGKVAHPLINYFFKVTDNGNYQRNENPWPETDF
ncbi:MAG: heat shock protein HspQ [Candidatus Omnitrophica bacterium]|nr:heat shock protein HspQ [Candidatus Omnitrophota bacterium]